MNLIDELESTLSDNSISRRAEILRRVTDLFALGSGSLSDAQVEVFGEVMGKLAANIEASARAAFGSRLAQFPDAPSKLVRELAFDDAIEVAGPVLRNSARLDDDTLVENAETKGQAHLLAISARDTLTSAVTDVLIERGDRDVVANTARNPGARFSHGGVSSLVRKSCDDGDLALCVWSRPDIPRQNLLRLFSDASEATRRVLESSNPRRAAQLRSMLADAADQIQTKARTGSQEHSDAQAEVNRLRAAGQLDEDKLLGFAREASFDKAAVALSLMCDLPIGLVERALVQDGTEQILILAKAIGLSWETASALLLLHAGANGSSRDQLDQCFASYSRLQQQTARTAVQFYRMREKASRPQEKQR